MYIGSEILYPISPYWYNQMTELFTLVTDFLRSSYFVLIFALVATNVIANSLSTLDPLHFGIYALITFTIIWLFHYLLVPEIVSMFTGLSITGVSLDWWLMFKSNWYYAAISGIVGVIIGYAKGGFVKRERVYF